MEDDGEIEVFLRLGHFPHGAYQDLLKFPPAKVRYTTDAPSGKQSTASVRSHKIKLAAWELVSRAVIPVAAVRPGDAQVVHSTNNFIPITKKPWFVDTEHAWGLFGFKYGRVNSAYYRWQLKALLSQDNCKGVLAWSDKANHTVRKVVGEKLSQKVHTIRPALAPRPEAKRKPRDNPKFLFVGKRFYEKGGHDLLRAYEKVRRKTDATLTVISDVPAPFVQKYSKFKDIRFEKPNYSHAQLSEKFYQKSNIFVFPTYVDTFGMVVLEAMAHGLPTITTDCLAMPELVEDGRNGLIQPLSFRIHDSDGFLLEHRFRTWDEVISQIASRNDEKFIDGIADRMICLAEEGKTWSGLSKNCLADSRTGRLSISRRNGLLHGAYSEAVR